MPKAILEYIASRPDPFLLPSAIERTLEELFPGPDRLLPAPYKIFHVDEAQVPILGFPVAESALLKELESRLDRWITEETAFHVNRDASTRERAQQTFATYVAQLMRAAENALLSNLLSDYHAVFWLAHSSDLARHFCSIPRRIGALDSQMGRTQGDAVKYRLFGRWATETREQMTHLAARVAGTLDGEEQRGLQFFRLLQDDVLILTEDFVGPDLREMRSFMTGYVRRDYQSFRDSIERLRTVATDLLTRERAFRGAMSLFGIGPEGGITIGLLFDPAFQNFLFDYPAAQSVVSREEREQIQLQSRRLREFAILNQLRRAIVWMSTSAGGEIITSDRRSSNSYSHSTRPMDFGRPGVVDPMVYRFGLMYDISAFSETLGNIARGGRKGEISSYRQMLLFQHKVETIGDRHRLQFEKFLGDGAFYTTRRAIRLIRAAIEIQRLYTEMRKRGFAFNKGMRVALNYGYYRLLPMKGTREGERIMEFYGPGIVELSRLTTGKANKEIDEIKGFLIAHGYEQTKVQQFFAPLAKGVDLVDHSMHRREFYAYVNASGHLVNEGIVASFQLLQELSAELIAQGQKLYRLRAAFGTFIGFSPAIEGVDYVGARLIGMVSLKGLEQIEVAELVPLASAEVEATALDTPDSFTALLRQDYHLEEDVPRIKRSLHEETLEHAPPSEIVLCFNPDELSDDEVLIGQWNPVSDDLCQPLRLPKEDLRRLLSIRGPLTEASIERKKDSVMELYNRLCDSDAGAVPLGPFRTHENYAALVIGDVVERLG
jgi:hypothetical protein